MYKISSQWFLQRRSRNALVPGRRLPALPWEMEGKGREMLGVRILCSLGTGKVNTNDFRLKPFTQHRRRRTERDENLVVNSELFAMTQSWLGNTNEDVDTRTGDEIRGWEGTHSEPLYRTAVDTILGKILLKRILNKWNGGGGVCLPK
jgi:hypothetical protein